MVKATLSHLGLHISHDNRHRSCFFKGQGGATSRATIRLPAFVKIQASNQLLSERGQVYIEKKCFYKGGNLGMEKLRAHFVFQMM